MTDQSVLQAQTDQFIEQYKRILAQIGRVIVGQQRVVEGTLTAAKTGATLATVTVRVWVVTPPSSSVTVAVTTY